MAYLPRAPWSRERRSTWPLVWPLLLSCAVLSNAPPPSLAVVGSLAETAWALAPLPQLSSWDCVKLHGRCGLWTGRLQSMMLREG